METENCWNHYEVEMYRKFEYELQVLEQKLKFIKIINEGGRKRLRIKV